MSGIFAIVNADGSPISTANIRTMSKSVQKFGTRKPGIWQSHQVAIGIHPFSITNDARESSTPLVNSDGNVCIVLDGWLSNRRDICGYLEISNSEAEMMSDAHLALEMYCLFGKSFPSQVEGEFSAIIWDGRLKRMMAVSDIVGTRPLYYHCTERGVIIATSLQAVRDTASTSIRPDLNSLRAILLNEYSFALTSTVYENIGRVPPCSVVLLEPQGIVTEQYLDLKDNAIAVDVPPDEQIAAFRASFFHSVRETVRDVSGPVAFQVSGGVDSSSVASTARALASSDLQQLKARLYSYQSSRYPSANEREYLSVLRQQCEPWPLTVLDFDKMWTLKDCDEDEGFPLEEPEPPGLRRPQLDTMRAAAADGCTVIVGGYAGDQVLRADDSYFPTTFLSYASDRKPSQLIDLLRSYHTPLWRVFLFGIVQQLAISCVPGYASDKFRAFRNWLRKPDWILGGTVVHRRPAVSTRLDLRHAVVDACVNGAWQMNFSWLSELGALTGTQMRFPFLNRRVLEVLLRSQSTYFFQNRQNKWILRQALQGILPERIRARSSWCISDDIIELGLRKERCRVLALLEEPRSADLGLIDAAKLKRAWKRYWQGENTEQSLLLSWLRIELWLRGKFTG